MNKEVLLDIFEKTKFNEYQIYKEGNVNILKTSGFVDKFKSPLVMYLQEAKVLDLNQEPLFIFYGVLFNKGDFFTADRSKHYMLIFLEDKVIWHFHEETTGWNNMDDQNMSLKYSDLTDVEIVNYSNVKNIEVYLIKVVQTNEKEPLKFVIDASPLLNHDISKGTAIVSLHCFFRNFKEQVKLGHVDKNKSKNDFQRDIKLAFSNGDFEEIKSILDQYKNISQDIVYKYYHTKYLIHTVNLQEAEHLVGELLKQAESFENRNQNWQSKAKLLQVKLLEKQNKPYDALLKLNNSLNIASSSIENLKYQSDLYSQYVDMFSEIPYQERKVILVSNQSTKHKSDSFTVLDINKLPSIKFPPHHPVKDEIYIGHPYNNTSYVSIQNYDYELLTDRINEYCYLLQCLGAESISIENINGEENFNSNNIQNKSQIDARRLALGAAVSKANTRDNIESDSSNLRIAKNQTFRPLKAPYIPTGLIWYPHEISWQRLVEQRMQGNLLEYNEVISSQQNQILNSKEIRDLQVDISTFVMGTNLKTTAELHQEIKNNTVTEWKVNVKFKPIVDFLSHEQPNLLTVEAISVNQETSEEANLLTVQAISTDLQTPEEQEYIDEINYMLADGDISDKEMRILDRFRIRLGLSEQKAQELLDGILIKYTIEEQELIEEIKASREFGELSQRDVNLLVRLGERMGIESSRTMEIMEHVLREYSNN